MDSVFWNLGSPSNCLFENQGCNNFKLYDNKRDDIVQKESLGLKFWTSTKNSSLFAPNNFYKLYWCQLLLFYKLSKIFFKSTRIKIRLLQVRIEMHEASTYAYSNKNGIVYLYILIFTINTALNCHAMSAIQRPIRSMATFELSCTLTKGPSSWVQKQPKLWHEG